MKIFIDKKMPMVLTFLITLIMVSSLTVTAGNYEDLEEILRKDEDRIYLDVGGAEIIFDEKMYHIYISDELKVRKNMGRITITSPNRSLFNWFNNNHKIVIGTASDYQLIDIDAGGVNLSGILFADELNIDAGGVDIDGEYYCRDIKIDGAGMDISGYIETDYMSINGAGMDIDIETRGLEEIKINGVGMDVDIKYLDAWTGIRHITLKGVGGDLNVEVPSGNNSNEDGQLDIDTSGIIETDVDYY